MDTKTPNCCLLHWVAISEPNMDNSTFRVLATLEWAQWAGHQLTTSEVAKLSGMSRPTVNKAIKNLTSGEYNYVSSCIETSNMGKPIDGSTSIPTIYIPSNSMRGLSKNLPPLTPTTQKKSKSWNTEDEAVLKAYCEIFGIKHTSKLAKKWPDYLDRIRAAVKMSGSYDAVVRAIGRSRSHPWIRKTFLENLDTPKLSVILSSSVFRDLLDDSGTEDAETFEERRRRLANGKKG